MSDLPWAGWVQIGAEDYVRADRVYAAERQSNGVIVLSGDFGGASHKWYAPEWVSSLDLLVRAIRGWYYPDKSD